MFGIGLPEMIVIMALALIVVGPDKLPDLARSIAKGVMDLKKTVSALKDDLAEDNPLDSVKPELEEAAQSIKKQIGDTAHQEWNSIIDEDEIIDTQADQSGTSSELTPRDAVELDTDVIHATTDAAGQEEPDSSDQEGLAEADEKQSEEDKSESSAEENTSHPPSAS